MPRERESGDPEAAQLLEVLQLLHPKAIDAQPGVCAVVKARSPKSASKGQLVSDGGNKQVPSGSKSICSARHPGTRRRGDSVLAALYNGTPTRPCTIPPPRTQDTQQPTPTRVAQARWTPTRASPARRPLTATTNTLHPAQAPPSHASLGCSVYPTPHQALQHSVRKQSAPAASTGHHLCWEVRPTPRVPASVGTSAACGEDADAAAGLQGEERDTHSVSAGAAGPGYGQASEPGGVGVRTGHGEEVLQLRRLLEQSRASEAAAKQRAAELAATVKAAGLARVTLNKQLDSARKAVSSADDERSHLKRRVSALQTFLSQERSLRETMETRLTEANQRNSVLQAQVEAGRQQLLDLEDCVRSTSTVREERHRAEQQVVWLQSQLQDRDKQLAASDQQLRMLNVRNQHLEQQVAGLQSALEQLYVSKIGREQLTQFQQMMTELTAQPTSRAAQPQPQRTQQHKSPTHKHASPQRAHTVRSIPNHPNQQQPASDEVTDKLASARPVQAVGPATLQLRPARVPHIQLTQPAAAHAVCSQSQLGRLGCLTDTAGSPPVATMPCSPGRNEGLEIGQLITASGGDGRVEGTQQGSEAAAYAAAVRQLGAAVASAQRDADALAAVRDAAGAAGDAAHTPSHTLPPCDDRASEPQLPSPTHQPAHSQQWDECDPAHDAVGASTWEHTWVATSHEAGIMPHDMQGMQGLGTDEGGVNGAIHCGERWHINSVCVTDTGAGIDNGCFTHDGGLWGFGDENSGDRVGPTSPSVHESKRLAQEAADMLRALQAMTGRGGDAAAAGTAEGANLRGVAREWCGAASARRAALFAHTTNSKPHSPCDSHTDSDSHSSSDAKTFDSVTQPTPRGRTGPAETALRVSELLGSAAHSSVQGASPCRGRRSSSVPRRRSRSKLRPRAATPSKARDASLDSHALASVDRRSLLDTPRTVRQERLSGPDLTANHRVADVLHAGKASQTSSQSRTSATHSNSGTTDSQGMSTSASSRSRHTSKRGAEGSLSRQGPTPSLQDSRFSARGKLDSSPTALGSKAGGVRRASWLTELASKHGRGS